MSEEGEVDSYEEHEEASEWRMHAALPVAKMHSFNANAAPQTGEEYLLSVYLQRNQLPSTITASNTVKASSPPLLSKEQDYEMHLRLTDPALCWTQAQMELFMNSHDHIFAETEEYDLSVASLERDPSMLNDIAHLEEDSTFEALRRISREIHSHELLLLRWAMAILLRIDSHLRGDRIALLRDIGKHCIHQRFLSQSPSSRVDLYNTIITLLSYRFGQWDLIRAI